MNKIWWCLGLIAATVNAHAAIPDSAVVLSCGNDRHLVQLGSTGYAVVDGAVAFSEPDRTQLAPRALTLLGRLSAESAGKLRRGDESLAALVDVQQPGRAYGTLSVQPGRQQQFFDYTEDRGTQGRRSCKIGPAFPALLAALTAKPEVSFDGFFDYMDNSLALVCRPVDQPGAAPSYKIRGLSHNYAESIVQVWDSEPTKYPGVMLERFEQRDDEVRYYSSSSSSLIEYPDLRSMQLVLGKAASTDALGRRVYAAEFFDGKRTLRWSCEPRTAFVSGIEKPLADARNMVVPKSWPTPVGTLAQAKRELCNDEAGLAKLKVRYNDLLFAVPGLNSHGIGAYRAAESPLGMQCLTLSIGVRRAEDLTNAKATIGATLEGYLVRYEAIGDIVAR